MNASAEAGPRGGDLGFGERELERAGGGDSVRVVSGAVS